jgi:hypothetical protein
MKNFKAFQEDMGGSVVGGIAGTGGKAGEPGVSKQVQTSLINRSRKVKPVDNTKSPRRVSTNVNVGSPLAPKSSYSEETQKFQNVLKRENSKTDKNPTGFVAKDIINFNKFASKLERELYKK